MEEVQERDLISRSEVYKLFTKNGMASGMTTLHIAQIDQLPAVDVMKLPTVQRLEKELAETKMSLAIAKLGEIAKKSAPKKIRPAEKVKPLNVKAIGKGTVNGKKAFIYFFDENHTANRTKAEMAGNGEEKICVGDLVKCYWKNRADGLQNRVFRVMGLYEGGTAYLKEFEGDWPLTLANIPIEWLTRVHGKEVSNTFQIIPVDNMHGDEKWEMTGTEQWKHEPQPTPPREIILDLKPGDIVAFASKEKIKQYGTGLFEVKQVFWGMAQLADKSNKYRTPIADIKDLKLVKRVGQPGGKEQ